MLSEWAAGAPQPPVDMDTPFLPQLLLTIGTAGGALLAHIVLFAAAPYLLAQQMKNGSPRRVAWLGVLLSLPAGTYATGLPVFSAVSADLPTGVIYLCGCLSIALALLAIHLMLDLIERHAPAASDAADAQPSLAV